MIAREQKNVVTALRKRKIKLLIIWLTIIAIPLTLFLSFYFFLGGKDRNYDYNLVKNNFVKIFQKQNYEQLVEDDFTTKGWGDVEEIFSIYQENDPKDAPNYQGAIKVEKVTNQLAEYEGVIYGVVVEDFLKGKNNYKTWTDIIAFMVLNSKIDGIIYYGN